MDGLSWFLILTGFTLAQLAAVLVLKGKDYGPR